MYLESMMLRNYRKQPYSEKYKTFIMGNNIICATDFNHIVAAKLYTQET
jgi:hypothetical protein